MDSPQEWLPRNLRDDGMIEVRDEHREQFPQTYVRIEDYNAALLKLGRIREIAARFDRSEIDDVDALTQILEALSDENG